MSNSFSVSIKKVKVREGRGRTSFSKVSQLAESIKKYGVLHPLTVALGDKEGEYNLVAGERRFRASALAGLAEVPCILRKDLDPLQDKEIELEENLQREDLEWPEQIELMRQIDEVKRKLYGEKLQGHSQEGWNTSKTADLVGVSTNTAYTQVRLAKKLKERPDLASIVKNLPMTIAAKMIERKEEEERLEAMASLGQLELSETLMFGDSCKILQTIPSESIDLVITDPPYGSEIIEKELRESSSLVTQPYAKTLKDFDNADTKYVKTIAEGVCKELARILKPSAHFYIFLFLDKYEIWRKELNKNKLELSPSPLIWSKGRTTTPFKGYNYVKCCEPLVYGYKPPREKRLAKPVKEILEFSPVSTTSREHPFEKPQDLLRLLITQSSNLGDVVLDPFAGSGATLIAAKAEGRRAIGIEVDPGHFHRAQKRIQGEKD